MSFWDKIIKSISDAGNSATESVSRDSSRYAFVDVEVGLKDYRIHDIGAFRWDRAIFHSLQTRVSCCYS